MTPVYTAFSNSTNESLKPISNERRTDALYQLLVGSAVQPNPTESKTKTLIPKNTTASSLYVNASKNGLISSLNDLVNGWDWQWNF